MQNVKQPLRMISYNVKDGFTKSDDKKNSIDDKQRRVAVAEWLRAQQPDIVAFQELNDYTEERLKQEAATWDHPHVALLKSKGYPTGLTSRFPISKVQRVVGNGLWHGFLKGETAGIVFYVTHQAPFHWETRLHEATTVLQGVPAKEGDKEVVGALREIGKSRPVMIVGDFNAFSPLDRQYYEDIRLKKTLSRENRNMRETSLAPDGDFDYSVMAKFNDAGLIDLVRQKNRNVADITSFPTLLVQQELTPAQAERQRFRIDYAMVSADLAERCVKATVIKEAEMDMMSDHYPLLIEFK